MTTTLKNGMYVTPPISFDGYITKDKKYQVFDVSENDIKKTCFSIVDDEGDKIICLLDNCAHIGGNNWKIVEL